DANLDFWAHAAVGRWVWQTGQVPDRTLFLWTASEPWVYHGWLSQVTFFGLTNAGSPQTNAYVVLAITAVLVAFPFALIWWVWGWTNFHVGVVMGLLVLVGTAACDLIQDRFDTRARALALLGLLAAAAMCVNPYGIYYWRAYLAIPGSTFATIHEWRPLWRE